MGGTPTGFGIGPVAGIDGGGRHRRRGSASTRRGSATATASAARWPPTSVRCLARSSGAGAAGGASATPPAVRGSEAPRGLTPAGSEPGAAESSARLVAGGRHPPRARAVWFCGPSPQQGPLVIPRPAGAVPSGRWVPGALVGISRLKGPTGHRPPRPGLPRFCRRAAPRGLRRAALQWRHAPQRCRRAAPRGLRRAALQWRHAPQRCRRGPCSLARGPCSFARSLVVRVRSLARSWSVFARSLARGRRARRRRAGPVRRACALFPAGLRAPLLPALWGGSVDFRPGLSPPPGLGGPDDSLPLGASGGGGALRRTGLSPGAEVGGPALLTLSSLLPRQPPRAPRLGGRRGGPASVISRDVRRHTASPGPRLPSRTARPECYAIEAAGQSVPRPACPALGLGAVGVVHSPRARCGDRVAHRMLVLPS
jgi:hypothetical protein